jgi:dihydroorotate dehydrogenase (fumarate)
MLKTKVGNIDLENCLMNASGVYCKDEDELIKLNSLQFVGCVICKSCTLDSRLGNAKPIYWDNKSTLSINSSGLPNNGYNFYIDETITCKFTKPYFVSISGLTNNDNLKIIESTIKNNHVKGIELNLSCPNVIGKPQIGYDFESMDILLEKVNKIIQSRKMIDNKFNFGLKLPPYFDFSHFEIVSKVINKYEIDTITCINSLGNGLVVDSETESALIKPKGGFGGIGGSVIKPIALANVRKFSELTNCDVIGCGGITSGNDAFEHILCGAKAVQIGTQFYMESYPVFERINNELKEIMKEKGYKNINDFCGKLKVID